MTERLDTDRTMIAVTVATRDMVKLAAAMERTTMTDIVQKLVKEYLLTKSVPVQ